MPRATTVLRDELLYIEIRVSSDHSTMLADDLQRGRLISLFSGEAVDRIEDAAGLVVAAIRHPMAGDTKRADQHWKLTGSPLARFLMITGRPQTRLGFWFFTIPRISVLEYK